MATRWVPQLLKNSAAIILTKPPSPTEHVLRARGARRLPLDVVSVPPVEVFKKRLSGAAWHLVVPLGK